MIHQKTDFMENSIVLNIRVILFVKFMYIGIYLESLNLGEAILYGNPTPCCQIRFVHNMIKLKGSKCIEICNHLKENIILEVWGRRRNPSF